MLENFLNKLNNYEELIYKLIKTWFVFALFFNSYLFQYIPIILFKIPSENLSDTMNVFLSTFSSILLLIILVILYRNDLKKDWKIFKNNLMENLNIGFSYWVIGVVIMMASNIIINFCFKGGTAANEQTVQSMITAVPWLMVISAGFLAPFTEELVFRKSLRDVLHSKYFFAFVSFLIFGGAHVMGNVNNYVDLLFIIPYGALGYVFALAYYKTNTIFTSISLHMFHNTVLVIFSIIAASIL